MKQNIRLFREQNSPWSRLLDSNPQLFRELQGKLKTRNVVIAAAVAVIAQFMAVIFFLGKLPDLATTKTQCGRYGMALVYSQFQHGQLCYAPDQGNSWVINWQLWWLDLFITLSMIGLVTLLVVGTYMLIADLVQEEERGTLNFIRLTPQSAASVLLGKILGVPILLYTAIALLLPLHLVAGLQSHIPLSLILTFDLTVVAGCGFVYCLALLWSLLNIGVSGFKPWLATGLLGFVLLFSSAALFSPYMNLDHFAAASLIFHPGIVLTYLIDATQLAHDQIEFISLDNLAKLSFYGQTLWSNSTIGIGLILFNLSLWTYWCWSVLKRRFHNPQGTILSKVQSYWLTGWFVLIALGFTLQKNFPSEFNDVSYDIDHLVRNFAFLQVGLSLFGLGLIFALSPHRQTLYDWARYRHQTAHKSSLWQELVLGENSPGTVAVVLNLAIAIIFITPSIFLILPSEKHYLFWGFVVSAINILLYAVVAQFILTNKNRKRGIFSIATVALMIILPPLGLGVAEITLQTFSLPWLFSFVPIVAVEYASPNAIYFAIFGQSLAITVIGWQMTQKLHHAGASETKSLLSHPAPKRLS